MVRTPSIAAAATVFPRILCRAADARRSPLACPAASLAPDRSPHSGPVFHDQGHIVHEELSPFAALPRGEVFVPPLTGVAESALRQQRGRAYGVRRRGISFVPIHAVGGEAA